jgi:hypothetical protein
MKEEILEKIRRCFEGDRVLYSRHSKFEMEHEELGVIFDFDIAEAIAGGAIIEDYPNDKPFPSVLIFGETAKGRPIHVVCGYDGNEDRTIIVTTYEPDAEKWYSHRERRKI